MSGDFIVGGVARDEDFYFHKKFLIDLLDSLRTDHVLLISPRRTGKTSIMQYLVDKPQVDQLVIKLNVEELSSPAEFFIDLLNAIHEHQPEFVKKYLTNTLDFLKEVAGKLDEVSFLDFKIKLKQSADWEKDWKILSEQLMNRLVKSNQSILFIIDELPDMLISMQEQSADLQDFLHCFRAMRQAPDSTHIRWLVAGSVNIKGTLDASGDLKLINDFRVETLPALDEKDVEGFVQDMFKVKGVPYSAGVIPTIHALLGVPTAFFLQLLTQELHRFWRREELSELTKAHVEDVFNRALLGEAAHDKLQHFHSRIRLHYSGFDQDAAYALLNQLSQADESGIKKRTLLQNYRQLGETKSGEEKTSEELKHTFNGLLIKLQSDFYIAEDDEGKMKFESHLLKLWWHKHWAYSDV